MSRSILKIVERPRMLIYTADETATYFDGEMLPDRLANEVFLHARCLPNRIGTARGSDYLAVIPKVTTFLNAQPGEGPLGGALRP